MANCYRHVIAYICKTVKIKPMINQVEIYSFFQLQLNIDTMNIYGVVPKAWGPFNEDKRNFFNDSILTKIGKKYNKSATQVSLRWNIKRGVLLLYQKMYMKNVLNKILMSLILIL